jgi:hypothetical protein
MRSHARREPQGADRHPERPLARVIQLTEFPQDAWVHVGVVEAAPLLNGTSLLHALAHLGRRHAVVLLAQFPDGTAGASI